MVSCSLVLIVRNEAANLRVMLPKIPLSIFDECMAVDGNSQDNTVAILREAGIPVYTQTRPGIGAAMIDARRLVKSSSFIFFHPDGNENPEDLPRMLALLKEGRQFVVASRMIKGARNEEDAKFFKWRKYANRALTLIANLLFAKRGATWSTDAINGFRGVTCDAFDRMRMSALGCSVDYQMIIRAHKANIPITEFPTIENARLNGDTNFSSLSIGLAELHLLWNEIRGRE